MVYFSYLSLFHFFSTTIYHDVNLLINDKISVARIFYYVSQYYFSFKGQDGLRMTFLESIDSRKAILVQAKCSGFFISLKILLSKVFGKH